MQLSDDSYVVAVPPVCRRGRYFFFTFAYTLYQESIENFVILIK